METYVENIMEKSTALSYCRSCNKWRAHKENEMGWRTCSSCFMSSVFLADHERWARWFNPARGFVNLPTGECVRISFDSPEHKVLNALRLKYA